MEKKFLGTGSPKIDRVLNTRKEDLEIPTEWLRIIEKPDVIPSIAAWLFGSISPKIK